MIALLPKTASAICRKPLEMGIYPIYTKTMLNRQSIAAVSRAAAFAALRLMLRPAVFLALRAGLKYADLDALLRRLLVDLGTHELRRGAGSSTRLNASAVSVLTGLHRKEVARLSGESDDASAPIPSDTRSAASQVLLRWVREVDARPQHAVLSLAAFTDLARSWLSDVHPRAVLDELQRLGLVRESDDEVELLADSFVPVAAGDDRLLLMAENVRAHLETGLHNSLELTASTPRLEQAIWGEGMRQSDCDAVAAMARAEWAKTYESLYTALEAAPEATDGVPKRRMRIGMYVHIEPMNTEESRDEQ